MYSAPSEASICIYRTSVTDVQGKVKRSVISRESQAEARRRSQESEGLNTDGGPLGHAGTALSQQEERNGYRPIRLGCGTQVGLSPWHANSAKALTADRRDTSSGLLVFLSLRQRILPLTIMSPEPGFSFCTQEFVYLPQKYATET